MNNVFVRHTINLVAFMLAGSNGGDKPGASGLFAFLRRFSRPVQVEHAVQELVVDPGHGARNPRGVRISARRVPCLRPSREVRIEGVEGIGLRKLARHQCPRSGCRTAHRPFSPLMPGLDTQIGQDANTCS